jgi:hypothetical protein
MEAISHTIDDPLADFSEKPLDGEAVADFGA